MTTSPQVRDLSVYIGSDLSVQSHVRLTVSRCCVQFDGRYQPRCPSQWSSRWSYYSCHGWTTATASYLDFCKPHLSSVSSSFWTLPHRLFSGFDAACVNIVVDWMRSTGLLLNDDKSELMWCATVRRQHRRLATCGPYRRFTHTDNTHGGLHCLRVPERVSYKLAVHQWHSAAVVFHSSLRCDLETTVTVLCFPSSGSTVSCLCTVGRRV